LSYIYTMGRKLTAIATFVALLSLPAAFGNYVDSKTLSFYHTHTGKMLEVTFFSDGDYREDALDELNRFLADWRNGEEHSIDPELLDILWSIQQRTGHEETFEVISAYRSKATNEMLRSRSTGVAKNSQHIHGKAIDVRLRGFDTRELRDTALKLKRGGVGFYAKSDFVHIDTGRVRSW